MPAEGGSPLALEIGGAELNVLERYPAVMGVWGNVELLGEAVGGGMLRKMLGVWR